MVSGNKVTKFRKRKNLNIGAIIFIIIFVYVFISVYLYFTKDHLSIYEVQKGYTSDNNVFNGLILRQEKVFSANKAGYINYYHKDGDRVAKNATIYSINENKQVSGLSSNEGTVTLSSDNTKEIQNEIANFHNSYNINNYTAVYDFKYDLESTALEIMNDNMMVNLQTVIQENGTSNAFQIEKSNTSGLITYTVDNYENLIAEDITAQNFNIDLYKKIQMRTMDLIEANTPVYKMITSDKWNIILQLDKKQYSKLKEEETAHIIFTDNGLTAYAPISVYQNGSDYFAKLDLNKYLEYFINQRFVSIELEVNSAQGLKIPTSSIIEKEFYKVPLEFFTMGGDSDTNGLSKESRKKNGELELIFVPAEIYYNDETYGYIDSRLFEKGDRIRSASTNKNFDIGLTGTLDGVFNVNKGYAIFRRIETLYENEEYCIIKEGTEYGLSVYDHIALVGKTAVEQNIIY